MLEAWGLSDAAMAIYQPRHVALLNLFLLAGAGRPPQRWFSMVPPAQEGGASSIQLRLLGLARLLGLRFPSCEYVPVDAPEPVARWMARGRAGPVRAVFTYPSAAMAICQAAAGAGWDLRDQVFVLSGEPVTPARRRVYAAAGVRIITRFSMSEVGHVACACPQGALQDAPDDMHVWQTTCAVVSYRRPVAADRYEVDGLLFTTLHQASGRIWLNAESDDFGVLRTYDCGCAFDAVGLRQHLCAVSSFGKFTSDRWAAIEPRVVPLIEEALPRQFGGEAGRYQLVEEETPEGESRLVLLIHPDLPAVAPAQVLDYFSRALAALDGQANPGPLPPIRVRREVPRPTPGGKVLPYYQVRRWRPPGPGPAARP
jgi:hypothetical protein